MESKSCEKCNAIVPLNAKFCNKCGNSSFIQPENCPSCDYTIPNPNKVKFCPKCGKRIKEGRSQRKQIIAVDGEVHKCYICLRDVEKDFSVCPSCLNCFHFAHLANWIIEKGECPVCKIKLELI
ncbi:MAG: double zinc ribbon domain-containing protein [Candidatus Kariarchaeaceae archaeon]